MNRRLFLGALGAAVAGAVLDPERALWKPGKLISIPKPSVWTGSVDLTEIWIRSPFRVAALFEADRPQALVIQALMNRKWDTEPELRGRYDDEMAKRLMNSVILDIRETDWVPYYLHAGVVASPANSRPPDTSSPVQNSIVERSAGL
jgi:hypothetical protein